MWEWYEWRRTLVTEAVPNAGHEALVKLERRIPGLLLGTQNVDGLHAKTGSRGVVELHDIILRAKCSTEGMLAEPEDHDASVPPRCPRCGAFLRADVVWFGEMLPRGALEVAREAARGCDLFLSIGTSSFIYPAAALPYEARENGALLLVINPSETPLGCQADYALRGWAGAVLPGPLCEAFASPR